MTNTRALNAALQRQGEEKRRLVEAFDNLQNTWHQEPSWNAVVKIGERTTMLRQIRLLTTRLVDRIEQEK